MRRNWLFLLGATLLLPSLFGCRQTTGTSPLTPLGNIGPLAPVNGGTAAASLSPLGQPTRVPPPPTGSYSAPNNYMGGSPPAGQAFNSTAPYDSFSSVPPAAGIAGASPLGSGVAPTAYLEQAPNQPLMGPGTNATQPSMSPMLGGMRVIDMTQTPPPPGYHPPYQVQQYPANQYPANQYPANQYPGNQNLGAPNVGEQPSSGVYQPPYDVPPQTYNTPPNGYPVQTIQVPGPGEIASGQSAVRIQPNVGGGPSASIASGRELPMQPSVSEPSFQPGNQFPSSPPSTEPIDNRFEAQQENLPWRRPGTQF